MPETTAYSAVMAVHTLWLAARAAGLGLGWVSILDPAEVTAALEVPAAWTFIGYFCLGTPGGRERHAGTGTRGLGTATLRRKCEVAAMMACAEFAGKETIMTDMLAGRRDVLLASLLAALPLALAGGSAEASRIDPSQTIVLAAGEIVWHGQAGFPERSVEMAPLFGATTSPGLYFTLVKWYPGYMSAPHTYVTDRLCVVVSGTWWVNSGADFDPANTVPAPAGSFVRRVAHTSHYDGVRGEATEPAVIAICGTGPAGAQWLDASMPGWRKRAGTQPLRAASRPSSGTVEGRRKHDRDGAVPARPDPHIAAAPRCRLRSPAGRQRPARSTPPRRLCGCPSRSPGHRRRASPRKA